MQIMTPGGGGGGYLTKFNTCYLEIVVDILFIV